MTPRFFRLALTLWTIALVAFGWSQLPPSPAKWTATIEPASAAPGQRVEIVIKADIPAPWHLYSINKVEDGPFPTQIAVAKGGPVAEVGTVTEAPPLKKLDKNFGKEVEYYEGSAEFRVPVTLSKTAKGKVNLTAGVRFQLCNEGTCLPPTSSDAPLKVTGTVDVSGAAVTPPPAGAEPKESTWTATVEPANAAPGQRVELVVKAKISSPWHLYSINKVEDGPFPTQIALTPGATITEIGKVVESAPLKKFDKNFGKEVQYYEGEAEFRIPVRLAKTASGAVNVAAGVRFQLCNEGTCLPPTPEDSPLKVQGIVNVSGTAIDDKTPLDQPKVETPTAGTTNAIPPKSNVDEAKSKGLLAYLGLAIAAGFASLVTPCVFPMIPITVSFFSKRKGDDGMRGTLRQAIAYCLGIVGTFTALGVAVALIFGATGLQAFANNPYLNLGLAVVFISLAFSLFGFFEIGVPSAILTKLDGNGKGGLLGPILMGLTFSLTSFTCTLPFVGSVLVSASQGEVIWPVLGMVAFSSAFCLPFFLLALFPAALSKLPRSGAWLATVKAFMGFVELAAAVKFISSVDLGIIPGGLGVVTREVFLALWFGITLLAAMYLLGIIRLPKIDEAKIGLFRRGFGVATLVASGYLLLAINGRSIGQLEGFLPPNPYPGREGKSADKLTWIFNYDEAVAKAKAEGKPLFIDFTGIYCTNCRDMETNMFPRPAVVSRLEGYVRARLFTDRDTPDDKRNQKLLQQMTNTVTLPSYVADPLGSPQVAVFTRDEQAFTQFLDHGLAKKLTAHR